jgi:uncharacterized membrane protein
MAFFMQIVSIWAILWLISKIAWKEKLASHASKGRIAFSVAYIVIGVVHLVSPEKLTYMIPDFLPYPQALVYISGVMEILLAILLLIPRYQRWAGWGIIGLLVAVFPANINVAINHLPAPGGLPAASWYVWSRLAFQPIYIAWVWWAAEYVDKRKGQPVKKTVGAR